MLVLLSAVFSVTCIPFGTQKLGSSRRIIDSTAAAVMLPPNSKSPTSSIFLPASPVASSSPASAAASSPPACDFESYESSGCEDEEGSVCETASQKCVCRDRSSIRLLAYCLPGNKDIGQDCYTSAQCSAVPNAGCYIFGKEYDNERISGGHNVGRQVSNWPTGTCRCNMGHQWDNGTSSCVKKLIGSWCNDDWDCIKEKFNTQCSRPANLCECSWGYFYDPKSESCLVPKLYGVKCLSDRDCSPEHLICSPSTSRCVCPAGFHFDVIHPGCKPNDDSSCDKGYKWDEDWGRCIPARSSSLATGPAFPFNQLNNNLNRISANNNSRSGDPSLGSSPDESSSFFSTALLLVVPTVVAFVLLAHYCYFKRRDEDVSDLDAGALRSTHVHNLAKFCAYPPYGRSALIKGPTSCVGPPGPLFPGVPCCAVAGKLHLGPGGKLAILESVAEEGRLDASSEAGDEGPADASDSQKEGTSDRPSDEKTGTTTGDPVVVSASPPPPHPCSPFNHTSSCSSSPLPPPPPPPPLSPPGTGKQLEQRLAAHVTATTTTSRTTTAAAAGEGASGGDGRSSKSPPQSRPRSVVLVSSSSDRTPEKTASSSLTTASSSERASSSVLVTTNPADESRDDV